MEDSDTGVGNLEGEPVSVRVHDLELLDGKHTKGVALNVQEQLWVYLTRATASSELTVVTVHLVHFNHEVCAG